MHGIRQIAIWSMGWTFWLSSAAGQTETAQFFFGTNAYPASILERPRAETEAKHPELFRPPRVGNAFAYRVFLGDVLLREIAGTAVSSNIFECADGPEIALHPGGLRFDLLRDLYLTDVLHRSPQTIDEGPPLDPPPPSSIEIRGLRPTAPPASDAP